MTIPATIEQHSGKLNGGFVAVPDGIQAEGKCKLCKSRYKWNEDAKAFLCLCGRAADRYTIYIWHNGKRIVRGTDFDGYSLDAHWKAQSLIHQAEQEKKLKKFDEEKWSSKKRLEYRFDKLYSQYIEDKPPTTGYNRIATLKSHGRKFIKAWGSRDVREIKSIKDFFRDLQYAESYRFTILSTLKAFFQWLIDERVIEAHPLYPEINPPEKHVHVISEEDALILIEKLPAYHRPIFYFMMYQGCRPNEVRALRWDCIDIEGESITYRRAADYAEHKEWTKTGKIRDNYLFPETVAILPPRGLPGALVFKSKQGKPYKHKVLTDAFSAAKTAVEVDYAEKGQSVKLEITLYEFGKHSWATRMANRGVDPYTIQKWFGHSTMKMTEKYMKADMIKSFKKQMAKTATISKPSVGGS